MDKSPIKKKKKLHTEEMIPVLGVMAKNTQVVKTDLTAVCEVHLDNL